MAKRVPVPGDVYVGSPPKPTPGISAARWFTAGYLVVVDMCLLMAALFTGFGALSMNLATYYMLLVLTGVGFVGLNWAAVRRARVEADLGYRTYSRVTQWLSQHDRSQFRAAKRNVRDSHLWWLRANGQVISPPMGESLPGCLAGTSSTRSPQCGELLIVQERLFFQSQGSTAWRELPIQQMQPLEVTSQFSGEWGLTVPEGYAAIRFELAGSDVFLAFPKTETNVVRELMYPVDRPALMSY